MLPELISIVFTLTNPVPVSIPVDQGRALSARFLAWIRDIDPQISKELHDSSSQPRPYTVSSLQGTPRTRSDRVFLKPGSEVWFRVTSVSPRLTRFLITDFLPGFEKEITLSKARFNVKDHTWDPAQHSWAGGMTYANLIREDLLGENHRQVQMAFTSATAFHSHGAHLPFVLPELVLRSWAESWNAYSGMAFPESLFEKVRGAIGISYYKMRTAVVRFGKATFIGGVGDCTFNTLDKDPYWGKMLNCLASFAFFSGTGIKTTMGLGQTCRTDLGTYRK